MGINKTNLINIINKISPVDSQEKWDNSGLQVDNQKSDIKKILIALEITPEVLEKAIESKIDAILVHHPLIFSPLYQLNSSRYEDNMIFQIIKNNIFVYACHTDFDKAPNGNNFYLANLLNLNNISLFKKEGSIGLSGYLREKMDFVEFKKYVIDKLEIFEWELKIAGSIKNKIEKISICSGAGGDQILAAKEEDCDVYITGDLKYHDAIKAKGINLMVFDAGHYGTEKFFVENISAQIKDMVSDEIEVIEFRENINPFIGY